MKVAGRLLPGILIVVSACASSTLSEKLSKLPFRFEANGGRDPHKGVLYTARGSNVNLSLGPDENWLTWTNQSSRRKVDVHTRLVGANRAAQMGRASCRERVCHNV